MGRKDNVFPGSTVASADLNAGIGRRGDECSHAHHVEISKNMEPIFPFSVTRLSRHFQQDPDPVLASNLQASTLPEWLPPPW